MRTNLHRTIALTFALLIALPAAADPPKKGKEPGGVPAPAPTDPNLNWKRLKITLGDVHVEGGTVSQPDAVLEKVKPLFAICYSRSVAHGWKQQGTAAFTLSLNATGKVLNVHVTPRPGKGLAQGLASCWSSAARVAHFEHPSGDGVSLNFEVEFSPEHGPPQQPEAMPKYSGPVKVIAGGQISTSGEPMGDAALGILHWSSTLKPCGDLARGAPDMNNGLLGSFDLRVTAAPDGKVSHVPPLAEIMARPSHPDPLLQNAVACVLEHAQLLHFAPRSGESQLQVRIEFRKAVSAAHPAR